MNFRQRKEFAGMPIGIAMLGLPIFLLTTVLAVRLVWEQTFLSWESGPQMIGSYLVHAGFFILYIFPPVLLIWILVVLGMTIRDLIKRQHVSFKRWLSIIIVSLPLIALSIPYELWQRLFIDKFSNEHATELFIHAAAHGDFKTLEAFRQRGIDVNSINYDSSTALHAAAVEGKTKIIQHLLDIGANPNAINRWGHTPLDNAIEMKRTEAITVLKERTSSRDSLSK
ncbi:MAG: ankyrin repeat domain-containing protein [Bacteroidota bacterium]|jgi:hypothetical protein